MADDVMIFPDTWEEFEKHFGFHDIKQAYMFGNTRLIPSFRVQQWLNHLDDIKQKQSQKNKMEAVAQLFGKTLGEEFIMKWGNVEYMCEFTARGLRCYPSAKNDIKFNYSNNDWLFLLLIGEAVIVDD